MDKISGYEAGQCEAGQEEEEIMTLIEYAHATRGQVCQCVCHRIPVGDMRFCDCAVMHGDVRECFLRSQNENHPNRN